MIMFDFSAKNYGSEEENGLNTKEKLPGKDGQSVLEYKPDRPFKEGSEKSGGLRSGIPVEKEECSSR